MGVPKTSDHIQIEIKMPNYSQEPPASSKARSKDLKDMDVHCTFKSIKRAKIQIIGVSEGSYHFQIKIKMTNPSKEPLASSRASNEDLKDVDVLWTFKIKLESQNSDHECKKTTDHIQIKIKRPTPSKEASASSIDPNQDLKDMEVLFTFKSR